MKFYTYSFNGELSWQLFVFLPYVNAQVNLCGPNHRVRVVGCPGDRPLYACMNLDYDDGVPRRQDEGTELFSGQEGFLGLSNNWPMPLMDAVRKACIQPRNEWWLPPDLKKYWRNQPLNPRLPLSGDKQLLVISNKLTHFPKGYAGLEKGMLDPNFIPLDTLNQLVEKLKGRYQVVYSRPTWSVDHREVRKGYEDLDAVRDAGGVVLTDYVGEADIEAWYRLILPVFARSRRFISVQGDTGFLSSYFGGRNLVLCRRGIETRMTVGDQRLYDYLPRLADTEVKWTGNDDVLLELAESWL